MFSKAWDFAFASHLGRYRLDGSPYIQHPYAVMERLLHLGCAKPVLEAALLHDVCEEEHVPSKTIRAEFGRQVAQMVFYLTKEEMGHDPRFAHVRLKSALLKLRTGSKKHPSLILVKMSDQVDNILSFHVFKPSKREKQVGEVETAYWPLYMERSAWLDRSGQRAFLHLAEAMTVALAREKAKQLFTYLPIDL